MSFPSASHGRVRARSLSARVNARTGAGIPVGKNRVDPKTKYASWVSGSRSRPARQALPRVVRMTRSVARLVMKYDTVDWYFCP